MAYNIFFGQVNQGNTLDPGKDARRFFQTRIAAPGQVNLGDIPGYNSL